MRTFVLTAVLVASATLLPAQTPAPTAPPTGAISGVVVDALTGEPIENASVSIDGVNAKGLAQTRQITDAKGRFVFVNLPPGTDYALNAAMPGFFGGGLTRGTGILDTIQWIPVKAGEWVRDLQIRMWKPGAISGRVLDESGEPVVGVFVRALKRAPIAGREQLVNMATAVTDDRGIYRVTGLDAGRYAVEVPAVQGATPLSAGPSMPSEFLGAPAGYPGAASPARSGVAKRARVYPITFFPAARNPNDAGVVEVRLGEERSGVDVALVPVGGFSVTGRLVGHSDGLTLRLMLVGLEALGNGSEAAQSTIAPDGAFAFDNVPAGNYILRAGLRVSEIRSVLSTGSRLPTPAAAQGSSERTTAVTAVPLGVMLSQAQYGSNARVQGPPTGAAFARLPVAVENDVTGLVVTLRDGAVMDVAVQFDAAPGSATVKPPLGQMNISLDAANGEPDLGIVYPTATDRILHMEGIGAGEFWLRVNVSNWVVKQIQWNGQDYTTHPFDTAATSAFPGVTVVVTDRVATISGSVKEKDAAVVMFPADPTQWTNIGFNPSLIKTMLADENGRFTFRPLPAGDYLVFAVPREERRDWLEPGYLARAARTATRVSVGWAENKTVSLPIVRVPR